MRLTKEEIQFIDQYLKKSEVVFDDLRLELVDHVASAVSCKMMEEDIDFYDAFKSYMVENKKNILKAGMVNNIINFRMALTNFFGFLIKKEVLIFSVIYLFLGINIFKVSILENLYSFQKTIIGVVLAFVIAWMILFYGILKKRIFILENNIILLTIYYYAVNFSAFYWSEDSTTEFYLTLISGLFVVLFIAFMIRTSVAFYKKNKILYEIN